MTNTQRFKAILLLASACAFSLPTFAGTVDTADFCVTETEMQLDIRLSALDPDVFDIIFQISPDAGTFTAAARESLSVNFDMHTGAITRQEPIVRTNGEPETDRWVDGPIENFTIVATGDGFAQLSGSVLLGNDKLLPGGTIKSIGLRDPDTVVQGPHTITACAAPPPPEVVPVVTVPREGRRVKIDGVLSRYEWSYDNFNTRETGTFDDTQSGWLSLPNGHMLFRYDRTRLYVLVDILDDNFDDPLHQGGSDNISLLFDVDGNGQVTEGVDVRYQLEAITGNLRYQTFASPTNQLEFNPPATSTFSARAEGFDCFTQDQSLFPTLPIQVPFSITCNRHRVWELAIDRREIGAGSLNPTIHMGIEIKSGVPAIESRLPTDISQLNNYIELLISGERELTTEPVLLPEPLMTANFSQGVTSFQETVLRVAGKSAGVSIMPIDSTGNQKYRVALHGQHMGRDLPGSPLLTKVKSSLIDEQIFDNWARLPETWLIEGANLQAQTYDHGRNALPIVLSEFVKTETPTYWIIPTKLSKVGNAFVPNNSDIYSEQQFVNRTFPVAQVDWVIRPEITLSAVDSPGLKSELNSIYTGVSLSWTYGLISTGSAPFVLPDMILAATTVGLCSGKREADCKKAGGSSWPVFSNGTGRIAWAKVTIAGHSTIAHEINHNLDVSSNGTWGRHVPGNCGALGSDSQWPYQNDKINNYGLKIFNTYVRSIKFDSKDFMGYCLGTKWTSPYRWNSMLNDIFIIPAAVASLKVGQSTAVPMDVLYVSGSLNTLGGGNLEPLILQPGTVVEPKVTGQYTLRELACDDSILTEISFAAFFEDIEGGALDEMQFSYQLAKADGICALQLLHNDQLLAERRVTANAPTVEIITPAGGTHWDGLSTISWTANDADDDPMQYMVFYSPDDGMTWVYLAGPISDTQLQIDSSLLQGSISAQVRVVATDGFNTSVMDTVDPFSVEASGPRTLITSHHDLQKVVIGQPLLLEGVGYDAMGQTLGGDAYRWFIDGEFAGIGSELPTELELGEYLIEFFAVGADDLTGSDSIHLLVVPEEIFINDFE